jgi:hypothetical protein
MRCEGIVDWIVDCGFWNWILNISGLRANGWEDDWLSFLIFITSKIKYIELRVTPGLCAVHRTSHSGGLHHNGELLDKIMLSSHKNPRNS